jgi:hypothetical protein
METEKDLPSRIIDNTKFEEKSSTPNAKSPYSVGERQPERDEEHPGEEIHAAEIGSSNEHQSNGSEDKLEIDHGRLWIILDEASSRKNRLL